MVPIHIRVLLTTLALLGSLTSARLPAAEEFQSRFEEQVDQLAAEAEVQRERPLTTERDARPRDHRFNVSP